MDDKLVTLAHIKAAVIKSHIEWIESILNQPKINESLETTLITLLGEIAHEACDLVEYFK